MNYSLDELLLEQELLTRELARQTFKEFVPFVNPRYEMHRFHEVIADHLDLFAEGRIKRLMITMPPQHGKSELSTRSLPCYMFGRQPDSKGAILSYSADKARKFSREVQLRISSDEYRNLFDGIRLATAKDEGAVRTQAEFDIVGHRGSLKAVGRRGPLTGEPVDWFVLDDLFKDNVEAQSLTLRNVTWDWIETVVETRMHNLSRMLYVTTRWHEDDPSGRFLARDGFYSATNLDGWVLLNFPAIKTADIVPYDTRQEGQALWPEKHSLHRMQSIKKNSPATFDALYQGDPKPSTESLVYPDWIEIDEYPAHVDNEFGVIDFGFTNDPTYAGIVGRTGINLYLDEKIYLTGLTNQDILVWWHALGLSTTMRVICEGAEPKSIEELRRGWYDPEKQIQYKGINAIQAVKGPGSVSAGISKLKTFRVHYTKHSLNIKNEKNKYQWIMDGNKATNTPIDRFNHSMDANRSGVFTEYSQPATGQQQSSRPQGKKPMQL